MRRHSDRATRGRLNCPSVAASGYNSMTAASRREREIADHGHERKRHRERQQGSPRVGVAAGRGGSRRGPPLAQRASNDRGLVIEPRSALEVHDTYFDTSDWRIRHAGFALRVRNAAGESEATLKELRPSKDGKADRRELTEPLTDASPDAIVRAPGPVGTRVHAVAGAHELQALFSASTTRQRFGVRKQDGTEELAEITLDATVFSRPDGEPQASTHVVEVESRTGESPPLEELVKIRIRLAIAGINAAGGWSARCG